MDDFKNEATQTSATPDLSSLLSDPNMISRVAETLKGLGLFSKATDTQDIVDPPPSLKNDDSIQPEVLPTSLPTLDPELMKKLPALISSLGSIGASPKKPHLDKRCSLLLALRPYLSENRQKTIDHIIRMNAISDILKKLK